jgi:hypothetical protein
MRVSVLRAVVRIYSYLFHAILGVYLFLVALVGLASGKPLKMDVLGWEGPSVVWWLLAGSLAGIASVALAVKGKLKILFLVWSVAVAGFMLRGFIFSPYQFEGMDHFRQTLYLIAGALLACLGSWMAFKRRARR